MRVVCMPTFTTSPPPASWLYAGRSLPRHNFHNVKMTTNEARPVAAVYPIKAIVDKISAPLISKAVAMPVAIAEPTIIPVSKIPTIS